MNTASSSFPQARRAPTSSAARGSAAIASPTHCWRSMPRSGKLVWQQQLVHHDLWDFDLAAQPVLGDIERPGSAGAGGDPGDQDRHAVCLRPRQGPTAVSDHREARAAQPVPGEQASPTQPFSSLPSLVSQKKLDPEDAWGITFWDRGKCRDLIAAHRNEGIFTPPDHPRHDPLAGLYRRGRLGRHRVRRVAPTDLRRGQPSADGRDADAPGRTWSSRSSRTTTHILSSRASPAPRTPCGASRCCPHGACRAPPHPGARW